MPNAIARLLAESPPGERLAVATSLVLYELAHSDHDFASVERDTIVSVMGHSFGVSEARVGELIGAADEVCKSQRDLHGLALAIKKEIPVPTDRRVVVEAMWRVVLSDGQVDRMEEMLANSVSSLLGIGFGEIAKIRKEIVESP